MLTLRKSEVIIVLDMFKLELKLGLSAIPYLVRCTVFLVCLEFGKVL